VAPTRHALGEIVVAAEGLGVSDARGTPRVRGASFYVRRHEVLGVAAVEGSGHRELLLALAGLRPRVSGALRLPERIGLIPADRLGEGLVPELTLTENVVLRHLGHRRGLIDWRASAEKTSALLRRFNVIAPSPSVRAGTLSGGNQQRLVVARELEQDVDLIVADNPTRGLDIRSTAFVHAQLREAAARGAAVIVHSSDLDEVLALATRILVVFHGEVREVAADRDVVGRAMLGAA
jgi:simple sugar transport system ATP-binding protein